MIVISSFIMTVISSLIIVLHKYESTTKSRRPMQCACMCKSLKNPEIDLSLQRYNKS